jgi:hypothetical protein
MVGSLYFIRLLVVVGGFQYEWSLKKGPLPWSSAGVKVYLLCEVQNRYSGEGVSEWKEAGRSRYSLSVWLLISPHACTNSTDN